MNCRGWETTVTHPPHNPTQIAIQIYGRNISHLAPEARLACG